MAEHSIDAKQRKHYLPLESNPTVFTQLISTLLGEPSLEFHDVFSIDEPGLLAMIPRPVFALVLVFPTSKVYEEQIALEEASREEYTGSGDDEDVIWYKQTIHNACGLYAILHGVSNIYSGRSRRFITPDSVLGNLLKTSIPLNPHDRALALEASTELEAAHADAARQGDTAVPTSAEDEVDFHYVCFIKSRSGRLYEMDGGKKGPVDRGIVLGDEDLLGSEALGLVREYIQREGSGNLNFSLMALTELTEDY